MRRRIPVLVAGLGICFGIPAAAQTHDEIARYCGDPHPEIRLLACKVIIDGGLETGQALADAFTSRGTAYAITGDQQHAIEDFDQALMLDPDRVLVYGYRGSAYLDSGNYDRAIADFDRAVQLDPDYVDALYGRAGAWRAKGDDDRAIADFTRVIELEPTYVEAFAYRGLAYQAEDELGRAIDDFDQVIRFVPDNAQAFNLLGGAHRQMGDPARAIKDYDEAIRLDPNYALAYFNRGVAKFVMKRFAEAATDFERRPQGAAPSAYAVLWLHMARSKSGQDDASELSRNLTSVDLGAWPGTIVRLYEGQATSQDVQTAAGTSADTKMRQERSCQASFYIAEYQLLRRALNTAVPILQEAATRCPHDMAEYEGTIAELGWLP